MEMHSKDHIEDDEVDENRSEDATVAENKATKKHKHRKNKEKPATDVATGETDSANRKQKKKEKKTHEEPNGAESTKKSKKKRKRSPELDDKPKQEEANLVPKDETVHMQDVSEPEDVTSELQLEATEELEFPEQDLPTLINRVESSIPHNDTVAFRTRVKKLDWSAIAFGDHTAEKCQETWMYIQKRQRQYRLLSEIIQEAKEWVRKPFKSVPIHQLPDFPKRPLTSYMLFYMDRKDKVMAENTGIKMPELSRLVVQDYNELLEQEKNKYIKLAAERKHQYEIALEEFYAKHPEISRTNDKSVDFRLPKKPRKPFALFVDDQLAKEGSVPDKAAFKEQCKETWKNMPEDKKQVWIEAGVELKNKYKEQVKRDYPELGSVTNKMVTLSKKEKRLVDRMDGKPDKPPNSAYSLYSRLLLKGDELKDLNPIERMKTIAIKWKDLPQEEKDGYRNQVTHLMEQYKLDYASYLDSLPQEKRELELQMAAPKRKGKIEDIQFAIKKSKPEDDVPKEKSTNSLIDTVIPQTWEDMDDGERSMYVKYVQKIKDYFDTQHQAAIEEDNARSDSDSESSE